MPKKLNEPVGGTYSLSSLKKYSPDVRSGISIYTYILSLTEYLHSMLFSTLLGPGVMLYGNRVGNSLPYGRR